jgi:hypothetical protein
MHVRSLEGSSQDMPRDMIKGWSPPALTAEEGTGRVIASLLLLRQGDSRLDGSYLHAVPVSDQSTDQHTAPCGHCRRDTEYGPISFNMCLRGAGPKKAGGAKVQSLTFASCLNRNESSRLFYGRIFLFSDRALFDEDMSNINVDARHDEGTRHNWPIEAMYHTHDLICGFYLLWFDVV